MIAPMAEQLPLDPAQPERLPFNPDDFDEEPTCRLCGSDENTLDEDEVYASAVCQALWARQTAAEEAA